MRTSVQAIIDELSSDLVSMVVLVHLDFLNDPVYFSTANGDIVYNGDTYIGLSDLIEIGGVGEDLDGRPNSLRLSMAIPEDTDVELILNQAWQGRKAYLYVCVVDDDWQIIDSPIFSAKFSIDGMPMRVGNENSVSVELSSELADWDRPNVGRYTHAFQQYRHLGDMGLEFVSETVDREINWGVPGGGSAMGGGGSGGTGPGTRTTGTWRRQ